MVIYPPFSIPHIIYLVLSAILVIFGCRIMYSEKISGKTKSTIIKICALLVIVFVIIKQADLVRERFLLGENNFLVYFFPNSFCSFSAFFLAIAVVCGKKDNQALHFLCYNTFIGCLPSIIVPDYLYHRPFFDIGTLASLTFHLLAVWIVISLFITEGFKPKFNRFWCYPVGFMIMIAFGYILVYVFGSNDAMNITKPLISGWNFTYWYLLCPVCCCMTLMLIWVSSKISSKITIPVFGESK